MCDRNERAADRCQRWELTRQEGEPPRKCTEDDLNQKSTPRD
jgi:hypothetical protein